MGEQPVNPPIPYAPPAPSLRQRIRRVAPAILLIAAAVSAYWWAPPLWFRGQVLYWQQRCTNHQAPPGTVIAEQTTIFIPPTSSPSEALVSFVPPPAKVPRAWERFYGLLSPPGFTSKGTVFLHERRRPNGERI